MEYQIIVIKDARNADDRVDALSICNRLVLGFWIKRAVRNSKCGVK